jgi:cellulose synthase operon protein C
MSSLSVIDAFPQVKLAMGEGKMLEAWKIAQSTGLPLEKWPTGKPLLTAAQLAGALGGDRLSRTMHLLNWRSERENPETYFRALFVRSSWVSDIELLSDIDRFMGRQKGMTDSARADLLAFQSVIHSGHRDFRRAKPLLDQAIEISPEDSWLRVLRSNFLTAADQYEEALEEARVAVEFSPVYHPAVLRCTEALIHVGRGDEALEFLTESHEKGPQQNFAVKLQVLYSEREDTEKAVWCLDEIERLSPLMEPSFKKWIAGRRSDFALLAGDFEGFLSWADVKGDGFQAEAAANFRKQGAESLSRKRLDVRFVRQHRATCAPSTLAALAAFWGKSFDHLKIAEEICYDGTPWHKERKWAEGNGFIAKEFRLTRQSLYALIDRGIPFTLTTQWTTGAHLQACIGYDARTDVILLRDPTEHHFVEMLMTGLIADHPLAGPRAMVFVPTERAHILEGIELADELVYESLHRLFVAFDSYDRFKMEAAVVEIRMVAPGHVLSVFGEMRAAQVMEDWARALSAANQLLERFPNYENLLLIKANLLLNLRRIPEYRMLLEKVAADPKADPVFSSDLGELLLEDARELAAADYRLKRALLKRRGESRVYENLARCRMKQRRFDEAAYLSRIASLLAPAFEPYASGYFENCRLTKRIEEGLDYLKGRTESMGLKSHGPWVTLAKAFDRLCRYREAESVLEKAISLRPDDGWLMLHGGRLMTRWGSDFRARAVDLIAQARGKVTEANWLQEAAETAEFLGERKIAIRHYEKWVELQPMRIEGWRALARCLAEEQGRASAIELLDEGTRRYPDFAELWSLLAEWLVSSPRGPMIALNRYLELAPKSRWGLRERALRSMESDPESALRDAEEAILLDPLDEHSHYVCGIVLKKIGRKKEAAEAFRSALKSDIDLTAAAEALMNMATDPESSRESLRFIEKEMRRQVSNGSIVLPFQNLAWRWIDPPELLQMLRDWCQERPDLWQTWSAWAEHALQMQLPDEAERAAKGMVEAFPLLSRAWLDLGKVFQRFGRDEEEVSATEKALKISPSWDEAARAHADALERVGRLSEAEDILRRAIEMNPLDGANHGYLADFLRRIGRRSEAFDLLRKAMNSCPFYTWGWTMLARWSLTDGLESEVAKDLEISSEANGHRPSWWSVAADAWMELGKTDEAIAAIRAGLKKDPEDQGMRDLLARIHCERKEFEEAIAVCETTVAGEPVPRELKGRRAWILMQSGRPVEAIDSMRKLVESEPDYTWGMAELAEWLSRRSDWQGLAEISRQWTRVNPQSYQALGYLGQAEEYLEHIDAAEDAFRKAWLLRPDYEYGARRLLDLQIKAGRFELASSTLKRLEYYVDSVWVAADGVELELKKEMSDAAVRYASRLLDNPAAGFDVLNWVTRLFLDHSQSKVWKGLLERRLAKKDILAPGGLAVYLSLIPEKKLISEGYSRVLSQPVGSPIRIEGWRRLIDLAGSKKHVKAIIKWSVKNRDELKSHAVLWQEMGGAFLAVFEYAKGAVWLEDWQRREDRLNGDTLLWYAALCDGVEDRGESLRKAHQARREALRRFSNSSSGPSIRASLAFHKAEENDIEGARSLLGQFEKNLTTEYYRSYAQLAEAVIQAADGNEDEAEKQLREAANFFFRSAEKASPRIIRRGYRAVARQLPWTRGKSAKLVRRWGLQEPPAFPWLHGDFRSSPKILLWLVLVIVIVARSCNENS